MFESKKEKEEPKKFYSPPAPKKQSLQSMFDDAGIKYFTAHEFLCLGGSHQTPGSNGYGLNAYPTTDLYPNIVKVAKVWDAVREECGRPLYVTSCYRNELYNSAVGGVRNSQHRTASAADVYGAKSTYLAEIATRLRDKGIFSGGIGIYNSFCHIDVRGTDADWDRRG